MEGWPHLHQQVRILLVGRSHQQGQGKLSEQVHQPAEKGPICQDKDFFLSSISRYHKLTSPNSPDQKKYHFLLLKQISPATWNINKQPQDAPLSSIHGKKEATTGISCSTGRGNTDRGSPGHPLEAEACCSTHSTEPQNKSRSTVRKIKIATFGLLLPSSQTSSTSVQL